MATAKTVWGIDVGQCALKALKLRSVDGELQVEAFDIIEHAKILSQPDADRDQLIQNSLEQFLARNSVEGSDVAIAVPGQSSFTRFVKLPPVEPKKIPDIVRFEAEQQIPFPIEDVIWRWQTFSDPDSPDVEVGLFAMKQTDVTAVLDHFAAVDLDVDVVQMAPLALYNFMIRDEQVADEGATLLADIGTDKTDLIVADGAGIWTRTIQIGGRNFTEALERAFKLSGPKAEKLKRSAATNKYARQVFQAMRPVFADLVQEIQRSIGYYMSLHRDARFKRLVGLGNGFRLPGLQKFLEQNLSIPVARIDSYNHLSPSAAVNAPLFTENVLSFAVSYGLALQALGEAPVLTNLLPVAISRKRRWDKKRPLFAAAAGVVLLIMAAPAYRAWADLNALSSNQTGLSESRRVRDLLQKDKNEFDSLGGKDQQAQEKMNFHEDMLAYRNYWPAVQEMISGAIADVAKDQGLMRGDAATLTKLKRKPRDQRRILILEGLDGQFAANVSPPSTSTEGTTGGRGTTGTTAQPAAQPGFRITLTLRTPMDADDAARKLINPLINRIIERTRTSLQAKDTFEIVARPTRQRLDGTRPAGSSGRSGRRRPRTGVAPMGGMRGAMGDMAGRFGDPMAPQGGIRGRPTRSIAGQTGDVDDDAPHVEMPDPLIPEEDMINDSRFTITWSITIVKQVEQTQEAATPERTSTGRRRGRSRR